MILLFCCIGFLSVAHANTHITSRAYYEDKSGVLDFEAAHSQDYHEFSGLLSKGYTDSAFWIRLHIEPGQPTEDGKLILRIRPSYLDEIRLYDPEYAPNNQRITGDRYPIEYDAYPSLYFNFVIPQGEHPRDIWLRLNTTSTNLIHIDALDPQEALLKDRQHELMFNLYLALVMLFLVWGLVHWIGTWDPLLGAFVIKQTLGLLHSLCYLGYLRMFWPQFAAPLMPDMATSVVIFLFVTSAYRFDYLLLREFRANRMILRLLGGLIALPPLFLVLALLGHVGQALALTNILVLLSPFLALTAALSIPDTGSRPDSERPLLPKRYAVILYALILLSISISSFPAVGLTDAIEWSFNGFLMYTLWMGLAVVTLLQIRAIRLAKRRAALERALSEVEQRVAMEETKRMEQGRFLAILTHELKTPLAVVRMVLGAPRHTPELARQAEHSIEEMSKVIERCMQADLLEDIMIEPQVSTCDFGELVKELVRSKEVPVRFQLRLSELPVVQTDCVLLRMTVSNLLNNALKYSAEGSTIEVRLEPSNLDGIAGAILEVANLPGKTGWPDADKVFKKYYREPSAHKFTGSGLGLFLIDGLARLLKGHIAYLPTQTHVKFRLCIPLSL